MSNYSSSISASGFHYSLKKFCLMNDEYKTKIPPNLFDRIFLSAKADNFNTMKPLVGNRKHKRFQYICPGYRQVLGI